MKKFILLILIATSVLKSYKSEAQVNVGDSLALVDLYNNTNGPGWKDHTGWLVAPVKSWYGIKIAAKRVYSMLMRGNNLSGTLPASIGNLQGCNTIDFGRNSLSGNIPPEIGNMTALYDINLNDNDFTGTVPTSLENLKNCDRINFGNNSLTGNIPSEIANMPVLTDLELFGNQLTGKIPTAFSKISNLNTLALGSNQLTGKIPAKLGNLVHLSYITLEHNSLTGTIPKTFSKLSNLSTLALSNNKLSGNIPAFLGNLNNLVLLFLSHNRFTDTIPASLGNLKLMQQLFLDNNNLSGNIPRSIDSLPQMYFFSLNDNMFTFAGMENIASTYSFAVYSPQAKSDLHVNGNLLSVSAGGKLAHNTFKWFKNGAQVAQNTGDSTFAGTGAGDYYVVVTNSVATALTLTSNTATLTSFAKLDEARPSIKNEARVIVYPNPVKDKLSISISAIKDETAQLQIIDTEGKILLNQSVNLSPGTSTQTINVSRLAKGNYFVSIKTEEGVKQEKFVKE